MTNNSYSYNIIPKILQKFDQIYFVILDATSAKMDSSDLNLNIWLGIILKINNFIDIDALYKSNMAIFQGIYDKYDNIREYIEDLRLKTEINDAYDKFIKKETYYFTGNLIADNLLTARAYDTYTDEDHPLYEENKQLEPEHKLIFQIYKKDRQKLIDFIQLSNLEHTPTNIRDSQHIEEVTHIHHLLSSLPNVSKWELVFLVLEVMRFCNIYNSPEMNRAYPSGLLSLLYNK